MSLTKRLLVTPMYLGGGPFAPGDVANSLKCELKAARTVCADLLGKGVLEADKTHMKGIRYRRARDGMRLAVNRRLWNGKLFEPG